MMYVVLLMCEMCYQQYSFLATQAKDIDQLIRAGLRNPVLISVKEKQEVTPSTLRNYYTICKDPKSKFAQLLNFLNGKTEWNTVWNQLKDQKLRNIKRDKVLENLKSQKI